MTMTKNRSVILSLTLPIICVTWSYEYESSASSASSSSSPVEENDFVLANRIQCAKLDLWLRGAFSMVTEDDMVDVSSDSSRLVIAANLEMQVAKAPIRHGPVRDIRRRILRDMHPDKIMDGDGGDGGSMYSMMSNTIFNVRGGGGGSVQEDYASRLETKLAELSVKFGRPFMDAIERVSIVCFIILVFFYETQFN